MQFSLFESLPLYHILGYILHCIGKVESVSMSESWELGSVIEDDSIHFIAESQWIRIRRQLFQACSAHTAIHVS